MEKDEQWGEEQCEQWEQEQLDLKQEYNKTYESIYDIEDEEWVLEDKRLNDEEEIGQERLLQEEGRRRARAGPA